MYTAIYFINKVMPKTATKLANRYFPLYEYEAPHDLGNPEWAELLYDSDLSEDHVLDSAAGWEMPEREEMQWEAAREERSMTAEQLLEDNPECLACSDSERYDDHIHSWMT